MKTIAVILADLQHSPLGTRSRLCDPLAGVPVLRRTVVRTLASRASSRPRARRVERTCPGRELLSGCQPSSTRPTWRNRPMRNWFARPASGRSAIGGAASPPPAASTNHSTPRPAGGRPGGRADAVMAVPAHAILLSAPWRAPCWRICTVPARTTASSSPRAPGPDADPADTRDPGGTRPGWISAGSAAHLQAHRRRTRPRRQALLLPGAHGRRDGMGPTAGRHG